MLSSFSSLKDPRVERTREYPLETLIFITISAVVSGANSWTEIEHFGKTKQKWLAKYVYLPENKAPCDDVYASVFSRIDSSDFSKCFIDWTSQVTGLLSEDLIAIDGKTLRGSYDTVSNKSAIHMINAWSVKNQLVLGQYKTAEKSNEITAIPALLNMLDIKESVISLDAMGTQKEIASIIISKQSDYILGLKGDQGVLLEDTEHSFRDLKPIDTDTCTTKGHGRIETRKAEVITDLRYLENLKEWAGLKSIIKVTSKQFEISTEKESIQTRYYISSLAPDAVKINQYIRSHWQVENKLHWTLDVTFKEDLNRTRTGHADANFSIIKQVALNILKLDNSKKSLNLKRYNAALDDAFRESLLNI